jgi:hypothetical protein
VIERVFERQDDLAIARKLYRTIATEYPGRVVMLCDRACAGTQRPARHNAGLMLAKLLAPTRRGGSRRISRSCQICCVMLSGGAERYLVRAETSQAVEVSHREGFLIGTAMASTLTAFSIASVDTAPFLSSSTILWSASYISGARAIR